MKEENIQDERESKSRNTGETADQAMEDESLCISLGMIDLIINQSYTLNLRCNASNKLV